MTADDSGAAAVARRAADLTTAIVAHRTTLLHGGERSFRRSGDGPDGLPRRCDGTGRAPVGLLGA